MPVSPNAATDELDSPFFKANEEICLSFDQFIVSKGGETRGNYNAFSYNVLGKVRHPNKWEFRIKKSSFTSGNLLLSSEYQSLHVASIWTAKNLHLDCPSFFVRKSKALDIIKIGLSKKWNWLSNKKTYVIKCEKPNHRLIKDLEELLMHLLEIEHVWEMRYLNPVLTIELRSKSTHSAIIEKVLAKNYD